VDCRWNDDEAQAAATSSEGEKMMTTNDKEQQVGSTMMNDNIPPHPQPHKQLLVGCITGGTMTMMVKGQQGGAMKGGQEKAMRRENEGNKCKAGPKQHIIWALGMLFFFFSLLYPLMVCFLSLGCKLLLTTLTS
jgi:hypothetical protein